MWRPRKRFVKVAVSVLVLIVALVGFVAWYYLLRQRIPKYESAVEHFKYASIGVEAANGVPYWIWYVLPRVFPDKVPVKPGPDGLIDVKRAYESFGFIWEDGHPAPIGLPVATVGFRRVGINCALCHTAAVRDAASAPARILVGAPSGQLDLQRYLRFLYAAAADPRFDARFIMPEVERVQRLPVIERWLYRVLVIPQMRAALLRQRAQLAWMDQAPDWGPGRSDPFNPAKTQILELPADGTVGNSDVVPLWNFKRRENYSLHWDGLNNSLDEVFLNSGIGNGASSKTLDRPSLDRMKAFVMTLPPPAYPYPIDQAAAQRGAAVFQQHCADCHAFGGGQTGQPVRLAEAGMATDAERWRSWSEHAASAFNGLREYPWRYTQFRRTPGYVAVPLDGVWVRAPYLHNGSVPSLEALLAPPRERPAVFYRGSSVYDPARVGFVSDNRNAAEGAVFRYDTRQRGNDNGGHLWGTTLDRKSKDALIEYLKTL